jgi:hypothetical protein
MNKLNPFKNRISNILLQIIVALYLLMIVGGISKIIYLLFTEPQRFVY